MVELDGQESKMNGPKVGEKMTVENDNSRDFYA